MYGLSFHSATNTLLPVASLSDHSPPPQAHNPKPSVSGKKPTKPLPRQPRLRRKQPSVIQIERAIGAGTFRDTDPNDLEQRKSVFDGIFPNSDAKFETPVEKKLRESGEWLATQTEDTFMASGKRIVMVVFQWILPIWALSLLVAAGIVKLPFSLPLLDDLIM